MCVGFGIPTFGEMAGILVSPRLDDRIRKRNALYKKRGESPKFRDVLREVGIVLYRGVLFPFYAKVLCQNFISRDVTQELGLVGVLFWKNLEI